jgi:ABC-type sugar transport system ATPase subunit
VTDLLVLDGVSKSFGPNRVLDRVTLSVAPATIHAIVGENGAGKSTLMNIIGGLHQPDEGRLLLDGRPLRLAGPVDAIAQGISTVHQELSLFPNRTVAQNIMVGREPLTRLGFVRTAPLEHQAREALVGIGSSIDPAAPLATLSLGSQQVVEIARALSRRARLLILDEPTSTLSDRDVGRLLDVLRDLRSKGVATLYISHKLPEVLSVADRISVLRDGRLVQTLDRADCSEEGLVRLMVGRESEPLAERRTTAPGAVVLEVEELTRANAFAGVSFTLRAQEILGFAGLVGAGRTEVARAIFGADPFDHGAIRLNGVVLRARSPREAIDRRLAYLTEDRAGVGLFLAMSARDNLVAASQARVTGRGGFLRPSAIRAASLALMRQLDVRPLDDGCAVAQLSGGNQQKVLLGRSLATSPHVLIADEPTRGVDVGAKRRIHSHLLDLADAGAGIILISSDLHEILGLSDRVAVFRSGRLVTVLDRHEATEEKVMQHAAA